MRKIKFLLGLAVLFMVSCQKDAIPTVDEVSAVNEVQSVDFENALSFIQNIAGVKNNGFDEPKESAGRPGGQGNDWIQIIFFGGDLALQDLQDYAYMRSDDQTPACANPNLLRGQEVVYTLQGGNLFIEINGTLAESIPVDRAVYEHLFSNSAPDRLIVVNEERTEAIAGNVPAVSSFSLQCNDCTQRLVIPAGTTFRDTQGVHHAVQILRLRLSPGANFTRYANNALLPAGIWDGHEYTANRLDYQLELEGGAVVTPPEDVLEVQCGVNFDITTLNAVSRSFVSENTRLYHSFQESILLTDRPSGGTRDWNFVWDPRYRRYETVLYQDATSFRTKAALSISIIEDATWVAIENGLPGHSFNVSTPNGLDALLNTLNNRGGQLTVDRENVSMIRDVNSNTLTLVNKTLPDDNLQKATVFTYNHARGVWLKTGRFGEVVVRTAAGFIQVNNNNPIPFEGNLEAIYEQIRPLLGLFYESSNTYIAFSNDLTTVDATNRSSDETARFSKTSNYYRSVVNGWVIDLTFRPTSFSVSPYTRVSPNDERNLSLESDSNLNHLTASVLQNARSYSDTWEFEDDHALVKRERIPGSNNLYRILIQNKAEPTHINANIYLNQSTFNGPFTITRTISEVSRHLVVRNGPGIVSTLSIRNDGNEVRYNPSLNFKRTPEGNGGPTTQWNYFNRILTTLGI